ncbi:hypothetical protein [Fibrella aquatilis]|uniref:Uncharacterized protein n=1 Tax=Fibrella aquatilis TaxID=2817059 RepID=A0A939GC06_9BACT|nr:hypothetical protein [Fibrella aquatilis]MBO0933906.1 hypothetical protein [Fibrella aquatilis]
MEVTTLEAGYRASSAGGIRRLRLVEATPALTVLDPARFPSPGLAYPGLAANNVLIAAGALVVDWRLLPGMAEFTHDDQYGANGYQTDCLISWEVPHSVALLQWLAKHGARRWVALVVDANDQAYVIGDPANGARLKVNGGTGRKRPDGGKHQFTLAVRLNHPLWLLDDFELLTSYRPEFDLSFDTTFTS